MNDTITSIAETVSQPVNLPSEVSENVNVCNEYLTEIITNQEQIIALLQFAVGCAVALGVCILLYKSLKKFI